MAMVDAEGRLFGRWNLVDAMAALVVLGLLPLSYGAYALFRTPAPVLTSVEPASLTAGPNLRVTVKGENLRPYLRVSFGTTQGLNFLFNNTTEAEVELGALGAGVYDVVLYDFTQERSRLPQALTIRPTPLPDSEVMVVGTLGHLQTAQAGQVTPGMALTGLGEVVAAAAPVPDLVRTFAGSGMVDVSGGTTVRVPAVVRAPCQVQAPGGQPYCYAGSAILQPGAVVFVDSPVGKLPFQIDQVRSPAPLESLLVTARFTGIAEALSLVRPGAVDLGVEMNELAAGARVADVARDGPGQVTVTLEVKVQQTSGGFVYGASPLRVGGPLVFRTRRYELQGVVIGMRPAPAVIRQENR